MRKFLRKSYPALLLFLTMSFTDIEHDEGSTILLGSWEYLAPNIGMTFQKGAVEFSYDHEILKGNVIFDNRIIPMENIVHDKNIVRSHIVIEGEQVDIFLRFESDSFTGTVSHPKGYIRISGKRLNS